jgi:acetyltransferase-like isoleucine patch superfamily enzyme
MLTSKPRLPIKEILLVGLLPSPLKKFVYRLRGYKIGRHVSLGLGSVVTGENVSIGDGVQIGFLSIIRGRSVSIGRHVQIGTMSFLDVPFIEIGEGSRINEQVFVGGLQFPNSKFVMGRNCQIMQMSFINPTRSITIGDDSGIGGYSLLFGHTSWLSKFEGYPVEFDSIEIGRSVSVAWRVFILPGAKIGDGTVIGANSLVRGTIPEQCLAVGFPARVVSKSPDLPRIVSGEEKKKYLEEIVSEMVEFFRNSDLICSENNGDWIVSRKKRAFFGGAGEAWTLRILSSNDDELDREINHSHADVIVSLNAITEETRRRLNAANSTWIDIQNKERSDSGNDLGEEVAMYLRRYGVRLLRERPAV